MPVSNLVILDELRGIADNGHPTRRHLIEKELDLGVEIVEPPLNIGLGIGSVLPLDGMEVEIRVDGQLDRIIVANDSNATVQVAAVPVVHLRVKDYLEWASGPRS